jgi:hypothetical protein
MGNNAKGIIVGLVIAAIGLMAGYAAGESSGEKSGKVEQFKTDCVKSFGIPIPYHDNLCVTDSGVVAQ